MSWVVIPRADREYLIFTMLVISTDASFVPKLCLRMYPSVDAKSNGIVANGSMGLYIWDGEAPGHLFIIRMVSWTAKLSIKQVSLPRQSKWTSEPRCHLAQVKNESVKDFSSLVTSHAPIHCPHNVDKTRSTQQVGPPPDKKSRYTMRHILAWSAGSVGSSYSRGSRPCNPRYS